MTAQKPPSSPPSQLSRSPWRKPRLPLSLAALLLALPGCALEWRAAVTGAAESEDEQCDDARDDERAGGPMAAAILDAIDPQPAAGDATPRAAETAPAPEHEPAGERAPRVTRAEAPIEKDLIRRVVRAHVNEVRDCYNDGLSRDPALAGRVVVRFTINAEGAVTHSQVSELELADEQVASCIAAAVKTWEFPAWPTPGNTVVNYPFKLEPG